MKINKILFLTLFFVFGSVLSAHAAEKGDPPVAYWRLDEGSGAIAYDDSDNNNDGTITGADWISAKYGSGLNFVQEGDYISVPGNFLNGLSAITLETWIKPSTLCEGTRTDWDIFLSRTDPWGYLAFNRSGSNFLPRFRLITGGVENYLTATTSVSVGQWYHIVGTYDGTRMRIYINGKEENNMIASGSLAAVATALTIGDYAIDYHQVASNAVIDDVKIYNYARTAEQIAVDYNAGFAAHLGAVNLGIGTDPNEGVAPVAYWKFDENTGITAYDTSVNAKNGTLINGPVWSQGKNGPCLSFDGVNDQVSAAGVGINTVAGQYNTVTFWMYWTGAYNGFPIELDGYRLWMPSGNIGFNTGNGDCYGIDAAGLSNKWVHVAAVFYNGAYTNNSKLYINGAGQALTQRVGSASSGSPGTTVTIAGYATNPAGYPFPGKIDDVKIYNYARTPAQIAWDYNKGKPLAHWRFDESAGTTIYDSSGNNLNGTLYATAVTRESTDVKYGKSMYVDDVGSTWQSIQVSDNALLGNMSQLSVSLWLKAVENKTWHQVIYKRQSNGTPAWHSFRMNLYNLKPQFQVVNTSGTNVTSEADSVIELNRWYHIEGVYNGSQVQVYVNGVAADSTPGSLTGSVLDSDYNLQIGGLDTPADYFFHGYLDDVRIYNYARTAEQVMQDYNQGLAVKLGD
jgi:hypothetical protein